ncbi:MAG: hypothetical protein AB7F35_17450 [Acetobacteraceae bacterium]
MSDLIAYNPNTAYRQGVARPINAVVDIIATSTASLGGYVRKGMRLAVHALHRVEADRW